MTDVPELQRWLATLAPDSSVGVDDGGLTLVEVSAARALTGAYHEIGGLPAELEPGGDPE